MANNLGALIKEARTKAGLTQEQLAKQVDNVTASDISKAERGEKELPQAALKQIAKATGVTQSSLLNAAKEPEKPASSAKKPAASTSSAKKPASTSSSAKKPASTTSTAKKPASTASSAKKPASAAKTGEQLTADEKAMLKLYRAADDDLKEAAKKVLKGEQTSGLTNIINSLLGSKL